MWIPSCILLPLHRPCFRYVLPFQTSTPESVPVSMILSSFFATHCYSFCSTHLSSIMDIRNANEGPMLEWECKMEHSSFTTQMAYNRWCFVENLRFSGTSKYSRGHIKGQVPSLKPGASFPPSRLSTLLETASCYPCCWAAGSFYWHIKLDKQLDVSLTSPVPNCASFDFSGCHFHDICPDFPISHL